MLSPIVPLGVDLTPAMAMHVLRSSVCSRFIGASFRQHVNRLILSEVTELPVVAMTEQELNTGIKKDLVASLVKAECSPESGDEGLEDRPAKKMRRDQESRRESLAAKTAQAKYALENRLAIRRVGDVVLGAADLINRLSGADVADDITDLLVSRQRLMSHMLVLDGALDRLSSDTLFQKREEGVLAGVALATDETEQIL